MQRCVSRVCRCVRQTRRFPVFLLLLSLPGLGQAAAPLSHFRDALQRQFLWRVVPPAQMLAVLTRCGSGRPNEADQVAWQAVLGTDVQLRRCHVGLVAVDLRVASTVGRAVRPGVCHGVGRSCGPLALEALLWRFCAHARAPSEAGLAGSLSMPLEDRAGALCWVRSNLQQRYSLSARWRAVTSCES